MKKMTLFLVILLASAAVGCVEEIEGNTPEPEPETNESTLAPTYIAGHMGNYADCPEEAFDPDQSDGDAAFAPRDPDSDDADCDGPDCGVLNCEGAQVTMRLANSGDEALSGITILELLILDEDLVERASLPVVAVNAIGDAPFEGSLAAGESVDLRIDYQGPLNLDALLSDGDEDEARLGGSGASLRILIQATGQDAATLDTPELDGLPQVDT